MQSIILKYWYEKKREGNIGKDETEKNTIDFFKIRIVDRISQIYISFIYVQIIVQLE